MALKDVVEVLVSELGLESFHIDTHKIDRNREHAFGFFPREGAVPGFVAIGGPELKGFERLRFVALVRWGRNGNMAEGVARDLYLRLAGMRGDFGFVTVVGDGALWNGMDGRGVYEYAVDFDVYLNRDFFNGEGD